MSFFSSISGYGYFLSIVYKREEAFFYKNWHNCDLQSVNLWTFFLFLVKCFSVVSSHVVAKHASSHLYVILSQRFLNPVIPLDDFRKLEISTLANFVLKISIVFHNHAIACLCNNLVLMRFGVSFLGGIWGWWLYSMKT
jgi:hypothetical protein